MRRKFTYQEIRQENRDIYHQPYVLEPNPSSPSGLQVSGASTWSVVEKDNDVGFGCRTKPGARGFTFANAETIHGDVKKGPTLPSGAH